MDAGDVAPGCEGLIPGEARVGGRTLMTLKVEQVGDGVVNCEGLLGLFW